MLRNDAKPTATPLESNTQPQTDNQTISTEIFNNKSNYAYELTLFGREIKFNNNLGYYYQVTDADPKSFNLSLTLSNDDY